MICHPLSRRCVNIALFGCRCCSQVKTPMALLAVLLLGASNAPASADHVRDLQATAEKQGNASWGRWGDDDSKYSSWTNHSNRLIPVYTFGIQLDAYQGENSVYRDAEKVEAIYGYIPSGTANPNANYLDQTDIYRLQRDAVGQGKKHIILIIFDGMDWQTTQAAAIYKSKTIYESGRGSGLFFQDFDDCVTDFGFFVCSPHNRGTNSDVNAQTVTNAGGTARGGYDARIGGAAPWDQPTTHRYLLGQLRRLPHAVTDSASSATSMTSGIKTYNGAINVDERGRQVVPIGRQLQLERGFAVGVVSSVPISHATPAAAYANNVSRNDYQDLTRDLLGLRSIAHRRQPLVGVDVLLGSGWGENTRDGDSQGNNFVAGNKYLTARDLRAIDYRNGGNYVVVGRTPGQRGRDLLLKAARKAHSADLRLFGLFGASGGHLPYQTADGQYDPHGSQYSNRDVQQNPTLADMTRAALGMLSKNENGFWLMIEAGDVDWANHANNIDNSIGAVYSGDDAFRTVIGWIQATDAWESTAVILTADHGHYFRMIDPQMFIGTAGEQ